MTIAELDEMAAQLDDTVPYYVPRLIAEYRALLTKSLGESVRYCPMCDVWVPRRQTVCRACGMATEMVTTDRKTGTVRTVPKEK